mmetsp:Transcript_24352/g.60549  ORF Transcript_24352/g.60549 Transcript_24352/m.60549 type:complete len:274 (-) Transcript_24352:164-985(-)
MSARRPWRRWATPPRAARSAPRCNPTSSSPTCPRSKPPTRARVSPTSSGGTPRAIGSSRRPPASLWTAGASSAPHRHPTTDRDHSPAATAAAWSSPDRRATAAEIARLSRHLASLPLDAKHRAVILRFAAVWNLRAGRTRAAAGMLATLSSAGGAHAVGATSALRRCAAAAAGMRGGDGDGGRDAGGGSGKNESDDASVDLRGAMCAATLASLPPRPLYPSAAVDFQRRVRICAVCLAAHAAEAAQPGAPCAVCDTPFAAAAAPDDATPRQLW